VKLRTSVSPEEAKTAGCSVSPSGTTDHAVGTDVPLEPQIADGWKFENWDGADADDVDMTEDPHVITMDSDKQVTAVFSQGYVLTTSTKGKGTVSADPPGPAYSASTPGTTVEVTASPNVDQSWSFVEWRRDASGTENPTDVVMDEDKHARAIFTRANKNSLTVTTPRGCMIAIEANPNGTIEDGKNPTEPGSTVLQFTGTSEVTLDASVNPGRRGLGYRFVRWEGDVPAGHETDNPLTMTVDSDKSVEAVVEKTCRLMLVVIGTGTVDVTAPSGTDVGDGRYVKGTTITLSAEPPANFIRWRGSLRGTNPEQTLTMNTDKWVFARFASGPGASHYVHINSADLEEDSINLTLAPAGLSGTLTLTLIGPEASHQIMSSTRGSGTISESFDIPNLAEGEYEKIRAEWAVSGNSAYDEYDFSINVLGTYNHTCYNTPDENLCDGVATEWYAYTTANGCDGYIPACDTPGLWNSRQGKPDWLEAIFDEDAGAGSGMDSAGNIYSTEYLCGSTAPHTRRLRLTGEPCGRFGEAVQIGDVAVGNGNTELGEGDVVYVHGHGTHTVTDTGGGVGLRQLDHYTGVGACNTCDAIGEAMTIKLNDD
jgi:hypothetical protein